MATISAGSSTAHPVSRTRRTRPSSRISTPVSFRFGPVANPIWPLLLTTMNIVPDLPMRGVSRSLITSPVINHHLLIALIAGCPAAAYVGHGDPPGPTVLPYAARRRISRRVGVRSGRPRGGSVHTPLQFQSIADRGACGKTRVVPHNGWPGQKLTETGTRDGIADDQACGSGGRPGGRPATSDWNC